MEDQCFIDREEALIQALISKLGHGELPSSAELAYIDAVHTYLGLGNYVAPVSARERAGHLVPANIP